MVVGASSAGLYAAELLARAGRRVRVIEQRDRLDPEPRTLIVTAQLERLLGPLPHVVRHRIPIMQVVCGDVQVRVPLAEPDLVVDRAALTAWLAARARAAGAAIEFGCRFGGVEPHGEGTWVHFARRGGGQRERCFASAVIGADGAHSRVARAAGLRSPPSVPIVQAEVELPAGWDADAAAVWFQPETTRFFFWLVPDAGRRAVIGLIAESGPQARAQLDRFLRRFPVEPIRYQAARVALYHPSLRPHGRAGGGGAPVMLVGDAAGQVKVSTVGGTVTGLRGAQAAAGALAQGVSYWRALAPLVGELNLHYRIHQALARFDADGYRRLVQSLTPRAVAFLSRQCRDEMAGRLWQLLLAQPRFVLLAAAGLLRGAAKGGERRFLPLGVRPLRPVDSLLPELET